MLYYLLMTLYIIACFVLILFVLLQPGKSDAAAVFGGGANSTAFGPRGTQTVLAKITIGAAVLFFVIAFVFAAIPNWTTGEKSVGESVPAEAAPPLPVTPAPITEPPPAVTPGPAATDPAGSSQPATPPATQPSGNAAQGAKPAPQTKQQSTKQSNK